MTSAIIHPRVWLSIYCVIFMATAAPVRAWGAEAPRASGPAIAGAGDVAWTSISGVTKQALFEARTGGYSVYRIPGVIVTGRGSVLTYCEARKRHGTDWDPIDVMLRRSTDGGATWDAPRTVNIVPADVKPNPAGVRVKLTGDWVACDNPVMIAGAGSVVHLLYCVNYQQCFYRRSNDDGVTFSDPVEITAAFEKFRPEYNWLVIATGPGHGIRLSGGEHPGRLVVAAWLSLGTGGNGHHPSATATIFSDDDGKSWQRGDFFARPTPEIVDPNETAIVQLSDGRVMVNTRTESKDHRRLIAISPDGATNWSAPTFDSALFEPVCFASLIRLPASPGAGSLGHIVFANPDSSALPRGKGVNRPRKNLTLRLSEDDGRTWPIARVLEPGISAYSDLAAGPDGTLYCFYECGGVHENMFDTHFLVLAKIEPNWLKADPAPTKAP